jgi:proteasome accessory factor C
VSRATANDRVRRVLAMVPWIASRPEGVPIAELCTRFAVDRRTLVDDLTTVSFVGVAPYTPDTQVDVVVEDGRVWVHLPQWFDRPLRLTPEQGLALVVAGHGLLSVEGADDKGPLARALDKVAATLGLEEGGGALDVRLGTSDPPLVGVLRGAVAERRRVRLSYYAYGRDEHTTRVVEPHRLYSDRGQLYLWAHCRDAGAERSFRVDRIEDVALLDETFAAPDGDGGPPGFTAPADAPRVTLELEPAAGWVAEHYPVESSEDLGGGRRRVVLAVTGRAWLERLLLRLGPEARVTAADGDLGTAGADAARRVLRRYAEHVGTVAGEGSRASAPDPGPAPAPAPRDPVDPPGLPGSTGRLD